MDREKFIDPCREAVCVLSGRRGWIEGLMPARPASEAGCPGRQRSWVKDVSEAGCPGRQGSWVNDVSEAGAQEEDVTSH